MQYGIGATDKFQGTGVFSGIKFSRDDSGNDEDDTKKKDDSESPSDKNKK